MNLGATDDGQAGVTSVQRRAAAATAALLGPAAFFATLVVEAPAGLGEAGWRAAGVACWMAIWWLAQTAPLAATALLPLVLLPAAGITTTGATAAHYAHPLIYLFLGGFLIALAIERCGLHRRLAFMLLARLGSRPDALAGGFMAVSALLSMWISNTATVLMLLPVGVSVLALLGRRDDGRDDAVAAALMLAIAYGASIGGMATLVGSPPNALAAAFLEDSYGLDIGFARWFAMVAPVSLVLLGIGWLLLTRVVWRLPQTPLVGARTAIRRERDGLGPMTAGERRVAVVALLTAAAWMGRPLLAALPGLHWLDDTTIAMTGALVLFVMPLADASGRRALDWEATRALPWGVLVLVGGGLALADAIAATGLGTWLAGGLAGAAGWPTLLLVLTVVAAIVLLTEITSNTATAATFVPLAAAAAVGAGMAPAELAIPAAVAASCAFMLPVATPPNAIVYGAGLVSAGQMARAGLVFNAMAIAVITLLMPLAVRLAFGAD